MKRVFSGVWPIERLPAVDGRAHKYSETDGMHFDLISKLVHKPADQLKGLGGCALSHLKAWKKLRDSTHTAAAVVLEDDVTPRRGFAEGLKSLMPTARAIAT